MWPKNVNITLDESSEFELSCVAKEMMYRYSGADSEGGGVQGKAIYFEGAAELHLTVT